VVNVACSTIVWEGTARVGSMPEEEKLDSIVWFEVAAVAAATHSRNMKIFEIAIVSFYTGGIGVDFAMDGSV
jgi:hypothetical protein